ncbi:hypothetical protein J4231_03100 [Candidatus Woesearchaeota archaeon]|nr:hypothetical protein [Candidatus Woesearchaeota archaeon]
MLSIRVLFVVTGFGYGDTVRVKAILDELSKEVKNLSAMFLGYDHSYKYFNKKYPTFRISGYNFPDSGMEFKTNRFLIKNFYLPITWLKDYMKHKKTIEKFNPNIIISDFEPVANIIARRLKKRCISIFGYDPVLFEKYNKKNSILNVQAKYIEGLYNKSDLVIIPTFRKKDDYSNVKYVNPIVSTGPDDLQSKPELMKKLKLKKEPILVMLGGSNYGVGLAKRILKETVNFNEDFIFFGSKKSIAGFHFKFAKNFLEYLKASKAVITLGGKLTLSECLVFKKPMLIFPIRNHVEQVLNAYSVRNVSMQGDFKKIKDSISIFLNNLESLNEKLKLLDVKPTGAKEAANIILEEITRE